jgi:hypothetical protein
MATYVQQSPSQPTAMLAALESLATQSTDELRIAVAYATSPGTNALLPRLIALIGHQRWSAIRKTAIVTTDFHLTEPAALTHMRSLGIDVRIAQRARSNYHPKVYAFLAKGTPRALVGSPNLTLAALTDNVEAAMVDRIADRRGFDASWNELLGASVEMTGSWLRGYRAARRRNPPPVPPDRKITGPRAVNARRLPSFADAVAAGLRPERFQAMWVEAGGTSGESHNQLEPPRGTHRFFGLRTGSNPHHFGTPVLFCGSREWKDRKLTWHGQGKMNQMERFNLPTIKQGGFPYSNATILFRRVRSRYQMIVAPPGDPIVRTWRRASRLAGHEYRVGDPSRKTERTCGLF